MLAHRHEIFLETRPEDIEQVVKKETTDGIWSCPLVTGDGLLREYVEFSSLATFKIRLEFFMCVLIVCGLV